MGVVSLQVRVLLSGWKQERDRASKQWHAIMDTAPDPSRTLSDEHAGSICAQLDLLVEQYDRLIAVAEMAAQEE